VACKVDTNVVDFGDMKPPRILEIYAARTPTVIGINIIIDYRLINHFCAPAPQDTELEIEEGQ